MARKAPSYKGLKPASARATAAARGASKKRDTKPEVTLRKALWHAGLRYRKNVTRLPGKPDVVFPGPRVAVFVDGDFWHGKNWLARKAKLQRGTNASYWTQKIERNMQRDRENQAKLEADGWRVLRYWESEVVSCVDDVVLEIQRVLSEH